MKKADFCEFSPSGAKAPPILAAFVRAKARTLPTFSLFSKNDPNAIALPGRLPSKVTMPAKPKLGQNFLNDSQAIQRIAAAIGDCSGRTVVEIGPGQGAITGALAARAAHVVAVELDPEMAAWIRAEFPPEKVTVIGQDVLAFDFATAARDFPNAPQAGSDRLLVVGNLPYYITSQILFKLAASHASIDRAVLMVQREVADRVTAEPGSRDYGLLSVSVQMHGPAQNLFTLPPSAFTPPPDVHSTVFRWRFAPRFAELGVEELPFTLFLRSVFAQKRKTVSNNLRAASISPAAIVSALERAGIPAQARAEALSIEELAGLWRELNREKAAPEIEAALLSLSLDPDASAG